MYADCFLNTVFDDVFSLGGSCRNNTLPWSPREKLQLVAILSRHVKSLSLQKKEYAISRSTWPIGTHSLAMDNG